MASLALFRAPPADLAHSTRRPPPAVGVCDRCVVGRVAPVNALGQAVTAVHPLGVTPYYTENLRNVATHLVMEPPQRHRTACPSAVVARRDAFQSGCCSCDLTE